MPSPKVHPNLQAGGDLGETLYKVGSARRPTAEPDNFVGEVGDLFYSMRDTKLRISDGYTVGGWYIIPDFESVDTDIIPGDGVTINIGGPTNYFGDLYVDNIFAGDLVLGGDLIVQGDQVVNNYVTNQLFTINEGSTGGGDGAGIEIYLTENNYATITYDLSSDTFVFNKNITVNTVYGDQVGDIYADDGTSQVLENGTDGTDAWFKGYVYGQVSDISNHRLGELLDVTVPDVQDGQALVYDENLDRWVPGNPTAEVDYNQPGNYAFKTILVDGQNNVVADSNVDQLRLIAGNNITITTDAANDAITISSTGGGGGSADYVNDLLDTDTTGITDGQVLAYDDATDTYVPATVLTANNFDTLFGAKSIDDLIDADISTDPIEDGEFLAWDATAGKFVPSEGNVTLIYRNLIGITKIGELEDVDPTGVTNGQVLAYDSATETYLPVDRFTTSDFNSLFGAKSINDLSDVDLGYNPFTQQLSITDGQVMTWDAANGQFVPGQGFNQTNYNLYFESSSIGDLLDINITNIIEGQTIVWDGGQGEFIVVDNIDKVRDLLDVNAPNITDGQVIAWDNANSEFVPTNVASLISQSEFNTLLGSSTLSGLDDVDTTTTTPSDGQILIWNGTNQAWEPGDLSAGGGGSTTLSGLTDTDTTGLQDGDALVYDSSTGDWKPVPVVTNGIKYTYDPNTGKYVGDTLIFEGNDIPIRSIDYDNEEIIVNPASFTPVVSASGQSLLWDQAASQFTVSVDNPSDYPSSYIASVDSISNATGVHSTIGDYTTSGASPTPAGGVDWTQTFTTNATATIVSNGTGTTGGSASADITFADDTSAAWTDTKTIYYNWGNVGASITATIPSGQTFLGSYSTVNYAVNITGLSDANNAVTTLTPTNGTLSNASGSGVFTPNSALIAGTVNGGSIDLSTTFTRPADVTGTSYTVTVTDTVTIPAGNFSYPSFYLFTTSKYVVPVASDIVDGTGFKTGVTELGDEAYTIDTYINNSASVARAFWLGIRSSATQPTTFKTGYDPTLLSDVDVETGNTVDLEPTNPPTGYVAEEYTLYGITLQPGNTYVRIN